MQTAEDMNRADSEQLLSKTNSNSSPQLEDDMVDDFFADMEEEEDEMVQEDIDNYIPWSQNQILLTVSVALIGLWILSCLV